MTDSYQVIYDGAGGAGINARPSGNQQQNSKPSVNNTPNKVNVPAPVTPKPVVPKPTPAPTTPKPVAPKPAAPKPVAPKPTTAPKPVVTKPVAPKPSTPQQGGNSADPKTNKTNENTNVKGGGR